MTLELLLYYSRWPHGSDSVPIYETMMARGCSYRCTYCCNDAFRSIYGRQWRVRRRSVANLMGELEQMTSRFPGFEHISIADDEFIRDHKTVREFCQAYRQTLDIPFSLIGFQPPLIKEENIRLLVESGLRFMYMGIQTGSPRTHKLYRRPVRREHILRGAQILHQFVGQMEPPFYDLIIDNPWETEQDQLETLSLLLELPKPFRLQLFSLTLYPGTELCERARREGRWEEVESAYGKNYLTERWRSYFNELFKLVQIQWVPRWLIEFLMSSRMRRLNWCWLPSLIYRASRLGQLLKGAGRSLLRRDWENIGSNLRTYLRQRPRPYQGEAVSNRPAQE